MRRPATVLAFLLLALAGPAAAEQPIDPADQAELDAMRDKWEAAGIDDYSYRISRICFCPEEFTRRVKIVVRNGRHKRGGGSAYKTVNTLDKVFRAAQSALDDDVFSIHYSPRYGFPKGISSNPDLNTFDEEVSYSVRRFAPAGQAAAAG
jgi:hypothetical protein